MELEHMCSDLSSGTPWWYDLMEVTLLLNLNFLICKKKSAQPARLLNTEV